MSRFHRSGTSVNWYGAAPTGNHLTIYANDTDTYPRIQLLGGANDSTLDLPNGEYFHMRDQTTQFLSFNYEGGTLGMISGPTSNAYLGFHDSGYNVWKHTPGQFNSFHEHLVGEYLRYYEDNGAAVMESQNYELKFIAGGDLIRFHDSFGEILLITYGLSGTEIYGTDQSGDDLTLYSNSADTHSILTLFANGDVDMECAAGSVISMSEGGATFLQFDENGTDDRISGNTSNNDLFLNPNGSGVVKFGTHSTIGAETVTGYITIKDAAGNTRKLAVVS